MRYAFLKSMNEVGKPCEVFRIYPLHPLSPTPCVQLGSLSLRLLHGPNRSETSQQKNFEVTAVDIPDRPVRTVTSEA